MGATRHRNEFIKNYYDAFNDFSKSSKILNPLSADTHEPMPFQYLFSQQPKHTHTQSTSSYHVKGEWDKCYVAHWLHFAHWSHRTAATARRPLDRVETIMRILFHGISLSLSPSPSPSLSSSCELLISLIRCTQCDRTRSMHILLANYNTFGWPYNYDLIFYGMQFIIIQMNTECNGCRSH